MRKKVFVGLSGGVDSSVAALRLVQAGYDVVGVFIKVWQPDFLQCDWEAERLDAMRVAAALSIPFLTCDATERYKADVVDYLIAEYDAGRTPNPDVMCNKHVKFGAFIDFADAHGAAYVATGHYARAVSDNEQVSLYRGVDATKDQSYFLWTLTRAQLARTLLPVGDTLKSAIRDEAARYGLPTARKADSQGVCFLGQLDMKSFLQHFIPRDEGAVEDETGTAIGTHDGARFYTIGQRHGFFVQATAHSTQPYYVIAKDLARNVLVVSHEQPRTSRADDAPLLLEATNWIADELPETCMAQTRYRQQPVAASVVQTGENTATVTLHGVHDAPVSGQSCVLYKDDQCLGGGIIT